MNVRESLDGNEVFKRVGACADELGLETYVVGGFVRDLILKKDSKDFDFVCVGNGIDLAKKVASTFGEHVPLSVFKNFGTAMIKLDETELEFVGARKESYRLESRKPIVEDGTLQEDLERRDFTINAMAVSLNSSTYGELLDPFDGLKDIKRKIIKTPPEADVTFSDD